MPSTGAMRSATPGVAPKGAIFIGPEFGTVSRPDLVSAAREAGDAGFDVLIEEFGTDMLFEVDAFWVQLGKRDPAKLIRSLKGRVTQVHLKDLTGGVQLPEKIPESLQRWATRWGVTAQPGQVLRVVLFHRPQAVAPPAGEAPAPPSK